VRRSLLYVLLACSLPAVGVIGWLMADAYRLQSRAMENTATQTAQEAMAYLERELAIIESTLNILATSDELASDNLAVFQHQAKDAVTTSTVLNFVLTDAQGHQRMNTLVPYGGPLPQSGTPIELQAVFQTGETVLTPLFTGPVTRLPTIAMGVPVRLNGQVTYSMNIGMGPSHVNRVLEKLQLPSDWLVAVIDQNGVVVGRTRDADSYVGKRAVETLWQAIQAQPRGILRSTTLEGDPVVTAHLTSSRWGWSVAVGAPVAELRSALQRSMQWGIVGVATALTLGMVLAWRLSQQVVRSVRGLNRQAQAVIEGRPVPPMTDLMEEAEDVSQALQKAADVMGNVRFQAYHDPLTHLGNRAYLEDEGERMVSLSRRQGYPLSLIVVDLDGFKAVNDHYGHAEGDRVLKIVADRLLQHVRREDVVSRMGGDEFCIMLYHTGKAEALQSAERLIRALSAPYPGIDCTVGASAGLIEVDPGQPRRLPQWMADADAALYQAKAQGKGRVVVAPPAADNAAQQGQEPPDNGG